MKIKKPAKLKRYPKKVVIEYAKKRNTAEAARRLSWVDSGGYIFGRATIHGPVD